MAIIGCFHSLLTFLTCDLFYSYYSAFAIDSNIKRQICFCAWTTYDDVWDFAGAGIFCALPTPAKSTVRKHFGERELVWRASQLADQLAYVRPNTDACHSLSDRKWSTCSHFASPVHSIHSACQFPNGDLINGFIRIRDTYDRICK